MSENSAKFKRRKTNILKGSGILKVRTEDNKKGAAKPCNPLILLDISLEIP